MKTRRCLKKWVQSTVEVITTITFCILVCVNDFTTPWGLLAVLAMLGIVVGGMALLDKYGR